jgi:multidrug transporter EmrE-like cation transporter
MFKLILLSFFTTLLTISGQVLWKIGLLRIGGFYRDEYGVIGNAMRIIGNPQVIAGFFLYVVATGFFMFLISKYDMSLVIPLGSVSFVFSLIAGACIFHEHVTMFRIAGVFVIIAGIFMVLKN